MYSENNIFPLLVTGLGGVPGYCAFYYFQKLFPGQVVGIRPRHNTGLSGTGIKPVSAEDTGALKELFNKYRFKAVIDASGCCALRTCEFDKKTTRMINRDFGISIMELAKEYGSRLLRFSTDMVFDGTSSHPYSEESPTSPITEYAKAMLEAELVILSRHPESVAFRISLPMGPSFSGHAGAIDWIESRFRKNLPATLYFDEVRNGIYMQDVIKVLEIFLSNNKRGIYNLGGPRPLSLYRIAQIINKAGNYPPELLKGCPRIEAGPMPPRVGSIILSLEKINHAIYPFSICPWPHNPNLIPNDDEWHLRRDAPFPDNAIEKMLYGYNNANELGHPLRYSPVLKHLGSD